MAACSLDHNPSGAKKKHRNRKVWEHQTVSVWSCYLCQIVFTNSDASTEYWFRFAKDYWVIGTAAIFYDWFHVINVIALFLVSSYSVMAYVSNWMPPNRRRSRYTLSSSGVNKVCIPFGFYRHFASARRSCVKYNVFNRMTSYSTIASSWRWGMYHRSYFHFNWKNSRFFSFDICNNQVWYSNSHPFV